MNATVAEIPIAVPVIAESFDRAAKDYRRHARVQETLAEWLAEWLPAGRVGRALEIGAGTGVFTQHLMPWAGDLVASDIAPAMCAAGRAGLPGIEWRMLAAETPGGGPWDWILSSAMLQWAAEPAELFAAWCGQLAPGGRVLAGLFVEDSMSELRALLGDDGPVAWRSIEEWRRCAADGGLRIVRDAAVKRVFRHESARAFLRSLHGTGAAPERRVAPARLRGILRDYEARHRDAVGVRATWTFYRFEAECATR